MNFDKIKDFWHAHWKHILILLLIFLVAFGFRILILRYNLMFGFDSYWDARINANLIQTGHLPLINAIGTYHNANKGLLLTQGYPHATLFWYIGYIAYKIVYFGATYSQELWLALIRFLPALYGALIALAMYLLFRWGFKSKKIGYIAGFVTAVMPAFIYRTMGGFYEPDSLGFLWMVLGFAFLIKALQTLEFKKANIIYSIISGLLFSIMAFSWIGYTMMPVFLEGFFVIYLIYLLIKKTDNKTIWSFVGLFAIAFVIMGSFAFISNIGIRKNWVNYQVNYAKGVLGIHGGANVNTQLSSSVGSKGVGEESNGKYAFHYKYGMFLPFLVFGLFALLYAFWRRKYVKIAALTFFWALLTFYFAWVKLKATYYFGLGLSAWVALTIGMLIIAFKYEKISKNWKIFGAIFTVFLLMGGTASGVIFTYNHKPSIDSSNGWIPALQFMQNKLPENAKMFNWWSWGHWITCMGHKRASTDNTNSDQQANADFGTFFNTPDSNEALGIIKAYDADYVVIDYQSLLSLQTYAQYANTYGQPNKFNLNNIMALPFQCGMQKNLNSAKYMCTSLFSVQGNKRASLTFDVSKMMSLPNKYTTKPTDILNGKIPAIYYTIMNKSLLYIVSLTTNKSYGIKLWFDAPETKPYFTEIYNSGYIKIWKVNKDAFKKVTQYMTGKTPKEVDEWNSKLWWLDQNTFDPIPPAGFMSK